MAEIFGDSLSDPRVRIDETDVSEIIQSHKSKFDAILLDVDNGPEGLTRKANDVLYSSVGLNAGVTRRCGPAAFSRSGRRGQNAAFSKRLRSAGFDVNEVAVRAHRTRRRRASRHLDRTRDK